MPRLLIPFLALMLFVGGFGVFLIVHDLSTRGQTALEQDLSRRLLDARSSIRDRELYLVESANFASNIEGISTQVRARNRAGIAELMRSVLALKTEINLLSVTSADGRVLVEFSREDAAGTVSAGASASWEQQAFIMTVLQGRAGAKSSAFVRTGGKTLLAIAAPVCDAQSDCIPEGAAVAGIDVTLLVRSVQASTTPSRSAAIYDTEGRLLASTGAAVDPRLPALPRGPISQRARKVSGVELATAYAPLEIQSRRAGTLALTITTSPAFASARGAGARFALILFAAMAGVVALGALLSRSILAQIRPLVATNRALAEGDLAARAVVLGGGELGELAHGVNHMAQQLQAMYGNLELRVEERTEEVRRLLAERTEFFASISHELRTPLAVILGQGKMMLDPKYPKNQRWTSSSGRTIVDTTKQLIEVVNEILDLARAEAGRLEMDIEAVEIGPLLKELAPTFADLAQGGGIHLTMVQPLESVAVSADRRRLQGVLVNLVDNAVKYTPAGGAVTISAAVTGETVEVSVSDTGVGISPAAGDMIFEPFFRVPGATAQRGQASSGLGLALSKRLIEAQGGRIWFSSEQGAGTTFTFALVRARVAKKPAKSKKGVARG